MATIEIIEGYNQGKVLEIQGSVTLGRAPTNSLCLHDSRASRQHSLIRTSPDGEGYILSDLGSSNGTYVDNIRIEPGSPHKLADGDIIIIASTRLQFHLDHPCARGKQKRQTSSEMLVNDRPVPIIIEKTAPGQTPVITRRIDIAGDFDQVREDDPTNQAIHHLRTMVKLAGELSAVPGQEAILDRVLNLILNVFPQADRAFVMIRSPETGQIVPALGRERNVDPREQKGFPISSTIINAVTHDRQAVLCANAKKSVDREQTIIHLGIRSVMCAPMIAKDEVIGIINVDSIERDNAFAKDDLLLLSSIAAYTTNALCNARLFDRDEDNIQKRNHFSRYVSPDVAKGIVDGTIPTKLAGARRRGTMLVSEITGFADMAERVAPASFVKRLNSYFRITTDIIARNRGMLESFGGRRIIAAWNVLFPDDAPEKHALAAALQMQISAWYFNRDLHAANETPISIGTGVNTGDVAAGNIGGERVEYAIMGLNMELAEQIKALAAPWQILVAESSFAPVASRCGGIRLAPLAIPGSPHPLRLVSLRSMQHGENKMLLSVPAHVLDGKDAVIGDGLITGSTTEGGEQKIFFSTEAVVVAGQEIQLHLDLPEYDRALHLSGLIEDQTRETYYGETAFSKSTLRNLHGDDLAYSLLRPGTLLAPSTDESE